MEQVTTTTKAKTMSSSGTHSSLLPPLSIGNRSLVMDWESEFVWECPKCPGSGRIPYSQLEGHRNWHERINHLIRLKTAIQPQQEFILPSFGPSTLGFLVDMNYAPRQGEHEKEELSQILTKKIPFATLKYVEGLKYTFGNKFVGRGSQGEFVFLSLSMGYEEPWGAWANIREYKDRPKVENYFALECKDTDIWVTSFGDEGMGPSAVVTINGVAIHPSTPTKVDFGDVLTVSIVGVGGEEWRFRDFVFMEGPTIQKVRRRPKRDEAVGNPPGVLQNRLVLQNVLGFLPTLNLQSLRVLSHLWNTEALKVLRNRVWVTVLDIKTWDGMSGRGCDHGLDFASSELNHLHFPHWTIDCLTSYTARKPETLDEDEGAEVYGYKMVNDLIFLLNDTHCVKSLSFSGHHRSSYSDYRILNVLLSSLRHSLTRLTLVLGLDYDDPLTFEGGFPSLRYLSIAANLGSIPSPSDFLRGLLPKAEAIQTLTLRSTHVAHEALQQIGILQGEEEGAHMFGNLRSVTILDAYVRDRQALSLLARNSLKEIHLGDLKPDGSGRVRLLMGLEHHAESLQELTLHFNLAHGDTTFRIDFPQRLLNLKTLAIFVKSTRARGTGDVLRSARCSFGENMDASFVDYRASFPSLTTLRIWPTNSVLFQGGDTFRTVQEARWNEFISIQMAFLAIEMDEEGVPIPMPSLQIVDTPFLIQGAYHPGLDHLETTFPNANFPPELASARGQPVWVPPAAQEGE